MLVCGTSLARYLPIYLAVFCASVRFLTPRNFALSVPLARELSLPSMLGSLSLLTLSTLASARELPRPQTKVYFDISIGGEASGRVSAAHDLACGQPLPASAAHALWPCRASHSRPVSCRPLQARVSCTAHDLACRLRPCHSQRGRATPGPCLVCADHDRPLRQASAEDRRQLQGAVRWLRVRARVRVRVRVRAANFKELCRSKHRRMRRPCSGVPQPCLWPPQLQLQLQLQHRDGRLILRNPNPNPHSYQPAFNCRPPGALARAASATRAASSTASSQTSCCR